MNEKNVNVPLLRKAVEWAEAEAVKPPELREWEQNWWVLTPEERARRVEVAQNDPNYYDSREWAAYIKAPECGTCYCIAGFVAAQTDSGAVGYQVEAAAAEALGLDLDSAGPLFDCDNTIEDVRRIAESLAGERL